MNQGDGASTSSGSVKGHSSQDISPNFPTEGPDEDSLSKFTKILCKRITTAEGVSGEDSWSRCLAQVFLAINSPSIICEKPLDEHSRNSLVVFIN